MSPLIKELRAYLTEMKEGKIEVPRLLTHMNEINLLMKEGFGEFSETQTTHYTGNSLVTQIKFADGKTYEIEIKEVRK
jgi:hypothetical protein